MSPLPTTSSASATSPLGSTSTTAPAPAPPAPERAPARPRARRRPPALPPQRLTRPESLPLAAARLAAPRPGDVRISRESLTLDVLPEARFQKEYEPIVSGALTLTAA